MALAKQFERGLDRLWKERSDALRRLVKRRAGPAAAPTRKGVEKRIERLLGTAEAISIKRDARKAWRRAVHETRRWHPKMGKGRGVGAKKRSFKRWYRGKVVARNCVYAFWAGKRCQYVGRTMRGKGARPVAHFEKYWFVPVTRINIHVIGRARAVPKAECLATHLFKPRFSKVRPARRKYYEKCPVCAQRREIKTELRWLFRLRA